MRLAANRAALGEARRTLAAYRQVQPALDLKHRALLAARAEVARALAAGEAAHAARLEALASRFPMLAGWPEPLEGRLSATIAGAAGPVVAGVRTVAPRGLSVLRPEPGRLADPPFLAALDAALAGALAERIAIAAGRETARRLTAAARTAAQRLNVVEKLLIPELSAEIRRVSTTLADRRRAAVVAARMAKRRLFGRAGGTAGSA